jgi:DUF4097 and DUF4098 domain-containing protein YvlB
MSSNKRILAVVGIVAITTTIFVGSLRSKAQTQLTQDFQQTYPFSANGRISLENINGDVRVAAWDRNEVMVHAVKRAYRQERLDEVTIDIDATADSLRIKTEYPHRNQTFYNKGDRKLENPAEVEYTLTVPRGARLDAIEAINGNVELTSLTGDIKATAINGTLKATGLTGEVRVSTINGELNASFTSLSEAKGINLSSVNGPLVLTLPSDAQAQLKADTVHGGISNEFGVPVRNGKYFGHALSALLGNGGARIRLNNVNGPIAIGRASDGRTPSRVTNLLSAEPDGDDAGNSNDNDAEDVASELIDAQNDLREAQREMDEATRTLQEKQADLARADAELKRISDGASEEAREAAREALNDAREEQRDAEREQRDAQREIQQAERQIQRLTERRSAMPPTPPVPPVPPVSVISRETQRDIERSTREIQRDTQRALRDAQREIERATRETSNPGNYGGSNLRVVLRENKTFSVSGAPKVTAETFDGSVTIRSWDRSEVAYEVVKRAEDDERMRGIRITATQTGNTILIKAEYDKTFARKFNGGWSANANANLEISVPRNATIVASSGDGQVRIDGIDGGVEARTGDGAITVSDSRGKATLQTGDGRISVDKFHGDVSAMTGDGSISLDGSFTRVSATTGDGSITLSLPAGANATIESDNDEVRGDGITLAPQTAGGRGTRRWNVGAGGPVYSLKTGDGRITVRQSLASN